jgi:hypothetical protein
MERQIAAEISLRRQQHDRLLLEVANRDRKALKATMFGNVFVPPARRGKAATVRTSASA